MIDEVAVQEIGNDKSCDEAAKVCRNIKQASVHKECVDTIVDTCIDDADYNESDKLTECTASHGVLPVLLHMRMIP